MRSPRETDEASRGCHILGPWGFQEKNSSRVVSTKDKVTGPFPSGRTDPGSRGGAPGKEEGGLGSSSVSFSACIWAGLSTSQGPSSSKCKVKAQGGFSFNSWFSWAPGKAFISSWGHVPRDGCLEELRGERGVLPLIRGPPSFLSETKSQGPRD